MKWFKHETDAHSNLKLQNVIDTYGLEAYGYYWMCVELVAMQSENFQLKAEKNWKNYLKKLSGLTPDKQEPYLQLFADTNLIDKKSLSKGTLYIPKLEERQDDYTKKVRRKYGQDTDNVHLEEKRIEKKRVEKSKPENSISFLTETPEEILLELSEKYKISSQGIKSKAYDLFLWCESNGKRKKDYKRFLETALRKDKQDLQNKFPYIKPIAPPPKQEEISPEQQKKNEEMRRKIAEIASKKSSLTT